MKGEKVYILLVGDDGVDKVVGLMELMWLIGLMELTRLKLLNSHGSDDLSLKYNFTMTIRNLV